MIRAFVLTDNNFNIQQFDTINAVETYIYNYFNGCTRRSKINSDYLDYVVYANDDIDNSAKLNKYIKTLCTSEFGNCILVNISDKWDYDSIIDFSDEEVAYLVRMFNEI